MTTSLPQNNIYNTTTRCVVKFYPYKDRILNSNIIPNKSDIQNNINNDISGGFDSINIPDQKQDTLPKINGGITNKEINAAKSFRGSDIFPQVPLEKPRSSSIGGIDSPTAIPRGHGLNDFDNQLPSQSTHDSMDSDEIMEDNDIISCQIVKDKLDPSDIFTLVIKSDKNWYNIVKPGDWALIYLDDISKINTLTLDGVKIIGQIDRIAKNIVTMMDGSIITTYTIHGSGWGKILEKSGVVYNLYYPQSANSIFPLTNQLQSISRQSPYVVTSTLLEIFLGNAILSQNEYIDAFLIQALLPPKLYSFLSSSSQLNISNRSKNSAPSLYDVMKRDFDNNSDEGALILENYSSFITPNLWSILKQYSNETINEIFTDTVNGIPTITLRKQPLTSQILSKYVNKNLIIVPESIIVNENLGMSDHELLNCVFLNAQMASQSFNQVAPFAVSNNVPWCNVDSVKRYGIRLATLNSEYVYNTSGDSDPNILLKWAKELFNYWTNYYKYESGTIDINGVTDFQLGNFIHIPEKNKTYQIEGISFNWTFGSPIVTSINLTHGTDKNLGFLNTNTSKNIPTGTSTYRRPGV